MVGSPITPPPHSKDDLYLLDKMSSATISQGNNKKEEHICRD
jgi:hypothetical protein